ncbi:MBL fold metallo-hydrolase [Maritimibacter dapengensis]|uniref:MBL fold metallo-hydrolase n=1 Tax=Maritimibacter dapengensis TaxID=2836868 RepID=A0ABS6T0R5_9RHOB|nr:MBL fold metallo-hydrolase [Maritimibacter dapengensis]MBV7378816.1 MBL fold metallo-hydrolase [Maritimibacter dapengensis]
MKLIIRRQQRAVGQGFFHTAELEAEDGRKFRYVYDCGAMKKYETQRNARIDEYLTAVGANAELDVLFISHIHFDHISGLERLLNKTNGLKVDTIVMPLINVVDRLFAYAQAANEDPATINDPFFRELVANPANALGRLGPRQLVFVRRGSSDGGAPGSRGEDDDDPDGPSDIPRLWGGERAGGIYWKLIGRGTGYEHEQPFIEADGTKAVTNVFEVDDTLAIATAGGEGCFEWVLSPFIDPTIQSKKDLFLSELALARGMPVSDLKSWLGDTANIEDLLLNGVPDLTAAYEAVADDFNLTSLCLYSGPKTNEGSTQGLYLARLGSYFLGPSMRREIGWLATGDAALRAKIRAAAFAKHYGSHMENTGTLTVPHHGSDHNHNPELVAKIDAFVHIAAADAYSKWKHPGSKVMQCVASMGRFLSVVTSNSDSEVEETISVSCLANRNP